MHRFKRFLAPRLLRGKEKTMLDQAEEMEGSRERKTKKRHLCSFALKKDPRVVPGRGEEKVVGGLRKKGMKDWRTRKLPAQAFIASRDFPARMEKRRACREKKRDFKGPRGSYYN